jgi:class 3 adenylate cyclase/tetratricopeptide (TPR) repeat protein
MDKDRRNPFQVIPGGGTPAPPGPKRRLAAVMFTDIKGFSRMMGEDEERTVRLVERHREVVRRFFPRFEGEEHNTIGDAFVALFESAVNAVQCGIAIQGAFREENAGRPREEQVWIRVGVHLGDILIGEDGQIYGDTVNIAARTEPMASTGGILITGAVAAQVRGKVDCSLTSVGVKPMKNIAAPPALYEVSVASDAPPPEPTIQRRIPGAAGASPARRRGAGLVLGVLFAVTVLSAALLGVWRPWAEAPPPASRTGSLTTGPSGSETPPTGAASGSETPPTGAASGSETPPTGAASGSGAPPPVSPVFCDDPTIEPRFQTGYRAFLAGHWTTAERELEAALDAAPDAPLGHLLLAWLYDLTGRPGHALVRMQDVYSGVTRLTEGRDLQTVPVEHLLAMAAGGAATQPDAATVEASFAAVQELAPELALGDVVLGVVMAGRGRCDRALPALRRALARDPSMLLPTLVISECQRGAGDLAGARRTIDAAAARHAGAPQLRLAQVPLHLLEGRPNAAIEALEGAIDTDPGDWTLHAMRPQALVLAGRFDDAEQALGDLTRARIPGWVLGEAQLRMGFACAGRGRMARAAALARSAEQAAVALRDYLRAWQCAATGVKWELLRGQHHAARERVDAMSRYLSAPEFPRMADADRRAETLVWDGRVALAAGNLANAHAIADRVEGMPAEDFLFAGKPEHLTHPLRWRLHLAEERPTEALAMLPLAGAAAAAASCDLRLARARCQIAAGALADAAKTLDGLLSHRQYCATWLDQGWDLAVGIILRAELARDAGQTGLAGDLLRQYLQHWPSPDGELPAARRAVDLAAALGI